ncbi:MAG: LPS export ABC transporter periplasmic protein LptC [Muribaculaceae bacterium]|nr:LPS export ABC transporter periplasmic protein LptC [Muribaculaceae bacterium]
MISKTPRLIAFLLTALLLSGGISIMSSLKAQDKKGKEKEESFTRPKPTQPIKPMIPSANRYQDDKVFLENADSLFRPALDTAEVQIVKGSVVFRQGGMWMYCDSAYYYPNRNSMDAFGNVEMRQGDTLFVYADKLFYNGGERHAILTHGPSRSNVTLKDPKVTLTTDSLDYDLNIEEGWYTTGGKLEDDLNVLTSVCGKYSPATKIAFFSDDVVLVNNKDGFKMYTQELEYNTDTHIAVINTETRIEGANDTILTTAGRYNTQTDNAVLTARSTILHRDSNMNVVTLEGDSIIYDKATRISRAYMFRDQLKNPQAMVLTDTARKMTLIGGYGEYNDSLRRAYSTEYPLLMEYSQTDTLFLRADTIQTFIRVEYVWPDSLSKELSAESRARLRSYKSPADMGKDIHITLETLPPGLRNHGKGNKPQPADTILRKQSADTLQKPQPVDTLPIQQPIDTLPIFGDPKPKLDKLGRDSTYMVPRDYQVAKAIGRARFFRQDLQGVADTMIYQEYDSMLYLIRKPIVWNEDKQIYGERIDVHFNDSTVDRAYVPKNGFMAESIGEDFYNQLAGKKMTAYFENSDLTRLEVEGNVETIFLPQENDSTYNKLVNVESSFLTIDLKNRTLDKLKFWPETTGSLTPIFLVKPAQMYLRGFRWYDALRPRREWYGDRWKWIDDLGEVPEILDEYFKTGVDSPVMTK